MARVALRSGVLLNRVFGKNFMLQITAGVKKGIDSFPLWSNQLQRPPDLSILSQPADATMDRAKQTVLYFPACITRMMGTYAGKDKSLMDTFMSICRKSGIRVVVPSRINGSCCGQIFSSKGFKPAYQFTANETIRQLWKSSNEGKFPIIVDVTSCAYTFQKLRPVLDEENRKRFDRLTILDSVDFLHDMVIPSAKLTVKKKSIVLHPVCSLQKMKTEDKFSRVAALLAEQVTIPRQAGCCGMAGDRGFLFPELTHSASLPEASEVMENEFDGYYSSTRTCELAMTESVKRNYESILFLVDEALDK